MWHGTPPFLRILDVPPLYPPVRLRVGGVQMTTGLTFGVMPGPVNAHNAASAALRRPEKAGVGLGFFPGSARVQGLQPGVIVRFTASPASALTPLAPWRAARPSARGDVVAPKRRSTLIRGAAGQLGPARAAACSVEAPPLLQTGESPRSCGSERTPAPVVPPGTVPVVSGWCRTHGSCVKVSAPQALFAEAVMQITSTQIGVFVCHTGLSPGKSCAGPDTGEQSLYPNGFMIANEPFPSCPRPVAEAPGSRRSNRLSGPHGSDTCKER